MWKGPQGEVTSCTIIVTEANQFMKSLHDRMPVILDPMNYERWLDPANQDTRSLKQLLSSAPNDWLTEWTVSRQLNNPRHEAPECAEQVKNPYAHDSNFISAINSRLTSQRPAHGGTTMNMIKQFAAALLVFALAASADVLAATSSDTITLETEFGQSQVLAWSWGASNSSSLTGGGGGAGKASFQGMSFTRFTDSQSPKFLTVLALGRHLQQVTIARGAMKFILEDVLVSTYSVSGSNDPKEPQTEKITMNFGRITFMFNDAIFNFDIEAHQGI